jgi:uncharacterized protein YwgA
MTQPRRNIELLMLGVGNSPQSPELGVNGITRFQKLLFLLAHEGGVPDVAKAFEFTAYKAGPYSPLIYDDLELLENLGLVSSESTAEASEPEQAELKAFRYEELMGDGESRAQGQIMDSSEGADSYEEKRYRLSERGQQLVAELIANDKYSDVVSAIRRIKSKYANYSLNDLLFHVYTKFPEMATESEIREKVLRGQG